MGLCLSKNSSAGNETCAVNDLHLKEIIGEKKGRGGLPYLLLRRQESSPHTRKKIIRREEVKYE